MKTTIEIKGEKLELKDSILTRFAVMIPSRDENNGLIIKIPSGKIITILADNLDTDLMDNISDMIMNRYQ